MRWAGREQRLGEKIIAYKILKGKSENKILSEGLVIYGRRLK
jgi:hypothetical protein